MASYATLAEAKAYLGDLGTEYDAVLTTILERSSRIIDRICNRRFDSVTELRVVDGTGTRRVFVPDLAAITALRLRAEGDAVWTSIAATGYALGPRAGRPERPALWIDLLPDAPLTAFPRRYGTVEITGTWGWLAVPTDITEATIELAIQMWRSRGAGPEDIGIDAMTQQVAPRALPSLAHRIAQYAARPALFA